MSAPVDINRTPVEPIEAECNLTTANPEPIEALEAMHMSTPAELSTIVPNPHPTLLMSSMSYPLLTPHLALFLNELATMGYANEIRTTLSHGATLPHGISLHNHLLTQYLRSNFDNKQSILIISARGTWSTLKNIHKEDPMKHAITVYECEIAAIRAANEERKKNGEDATVRAARRFVEMVEKDVEALRKRITEKEKKDNSAEVNTVTPSLPDLTDESGTAESRKYIGATFDKKISGPIMGLQERVKHQNEALLKKEGGIRMLEHDINEFEFVKARNATLAKDIITLANDKHALSTENKELTSQIADLSEKLKVAGDNADLKDRIERQNEALLKKDEELRMLEPLKEKNAALIADLKQNNATLQTENEELIAQVVDLSEKLHMGQAKATRRIVGDNAELKETIRTQVEALKEKDGKIHQLKTQIAHQINCIKGFMEKASNGCCNTCGSHLNTIGERDEQILELEEKIQNLGSENAALRDQVDHNRSLTNTFMAELKPMVSGLPETEQWEIFFPQWLTNFLDQTNGKKGKLEATILALTEKEEKLVTENTGLKQDIEKMAALIEASREKILYYLKKNYALTEDNEDLAEANANLKAGLEVATASKCYNPHANQIRYQRTIDALMRSDELEEKLADAQETIEKLEKHAEQVGLSWSQRFNTATNESMRLEQRLKTQEAEHAAKIQELEETKKELETKLAGATELQTATLREQKEINKTLIDDASNAKAKVVQHQNFNGTLLHRIAQLQKNIATLKNQLSQSQAAGADIQSAYNSALDRYKTDTTSLSNDVKTLQGHIATLTEKVQTLHDQIVQLASERDQLRCSNRELSINGGQMQKAINHLNAYVRSQQEDLSAQSDSILMERNAREAAERTITGLEKELERAAELEQRCLDLVKHRRKLEDTIAELGEEKVAIVEETKEKMKTMEGGCKKLEADLARSEALHNAVLEENGRIILRLKLSLQIAHEKIKGLEERSQNAEAQMKEWQGKSMKVYMVKEEAMKQKLHLEKMLMVGENNLEAAKEQVKNLIEKVKNLEEDMQEVNIEHLEKLEEIEKETKMMELKEANFRTIVSELKLKKMELVKEIEEIKLREEERIRREMICGEEGELVGEEDVEEKILEEEADETDDEMEII